MGQDDWYFSSLSAFMPPHSSFHLNTIAIFRGHKLWADKEQYNLCCTQMLFDFLFPFYSSLNICVSPYGDETQAFKRDKVYLKFIQKRLIFASIAAQHFNRCHEHLPCSTFPASRDVFVLPFSIL